MSGERVEERGGGGSESSNNTAQRYQRPNTEEAPHTLTGQNRIIVSSHLLWMIFLSTFCSWRFCFPPGAASFELPDETQEYSRCVEEQRFEGCCAWSEEP